MCLAPSTVAWLTRCCIRPWRLRIQHVDEMARSPRQQLFDRDTEVMLVGILLDVADMRRRQHVVQAQQRMVGAVYRFVLEHIDSREAWMPGFQSGFERSGLDHFAAARIDEKRAWLHAHEVCKRDRTTGGRQQAKMATDDIGFAEKLLPVRPGFDAIACRGSQRSFMVAQRDDPHAERTAISCHHAADLPIARDPERATLQ